MIMPSTRAKIEALLFYKSEPLSYKEIAEIVGVTVTVVAEEIESLREAYLQNQSGLRIVGYSGTVTMVTAPELSDFLAELTKQDQEKDLGPAGLETLTIILYNAPISRAVIDRVRGVNSSYIVRHLLVRGLIERVAHKKEDRQFLYAPSVDTLRFLGITDLAKLPDREKISEELGRFLHDDTPANA